MRGFLKTCSKYAPLFILIFCFVLSTLGSKPITKKVVSSKSKSFSSSESSDSSSSDDDKLTTKRDVAVTKKKVAASTSSNNSKKTIPLSKLGVSNATKKKKESSSDSSDSSDSSAEEEDEKQKKKTPVVKKKEIARKKVTVINSDDSSSSSSSDDEEPEVIKNRNTKPADKRTLSVLPSVQKFLDVVQTDNKKMKMTHGPNTKNKNNSSNNSLVSNNNSIVNKSTNGVDFHVSKLSGSSEKTSTPNSSNKNLNESAKAKRLAIKDVYKNKSQFVISKSMNLDTSNSSMSEVSGLLETTTDHAVDTTTDDVNFTTDHVPAGVLRKRRRAKLRKEKKRNLMQAEKVSPSFEINLVWI